MAKGKRGQVKILNCDDLVDESLGMLYSHGKSKNSVHTIILSVAFIDKQLQTLLGQFFIKSSLSESLLHMNGLLGSLRPKSDLAYALGLIPKSIAQMIWVMAEIRNTVAHSHKPLTFNSEEIRSLIVGGEKDLECLILPVGQLVTAENGSGMCLGGPSAKHDVTDPQVKFEFAVIMLMNALLFLSGSTSGAKRRKAIKIEPYNPDEV